MAVVRGPEVALRWAMGTFLLTIALTPIPFLMGMYRWPYLALVLAGVDTVLGYVVYILLKSPDRKSLGRISRLLKVDMLMGLAALVAGR